MPPLRSARELGASGWRYDGPFNNGANLRACGFNLGPFAQTEVCRELPEVEGADQLLGEQVQRFTYLEQVPPLPSHSRVPTPYEVVHLPLGLWCRLSQHEPHRIQVEVGRQESSDGDGEGGHGKLALAEYRAGQLAQVVLVT